MSFYQPKNKSFERYIQIGYEFASGKSLSQKEIDNGFQIKWVPLEEAIKLLENDKPEGYEGGFIQIRDSSFLKEAEKF